MQRQTTSELIDADDVAAILSAAGCGPGRFHRPGRVVNGEVHFLQCVFFGPIELRAELPSVECQPGDSLNAGHGGINHPS